MNNNTTKNRKKRSPKVAIQIQEALNTIKPKQSTTYKSEVKQFDHSLQRPKEYHND